MTQEEKRAAVLTSNEIFLLLVGHLFQCLSFRLRKKESREDTSKHEEGENLQAVKRGGDASTKRDWIENRKSDVHVLHEMVLAANVFELCKANLRNDGTEFPACSRNTMRSGTITGRERLSGDDEGCGVGTEVLEEVGEAVQENKGFRGGGGLG